MDGDSPIDYLRMRVAKEPRANVAENKGARLISLCGVCPNPDLSAREWSRLRPGQPVFRALCVCVIRDVPRVVRPAMDRRFHELMVATVKVRSDNSFSLKCGRTVHIPRRARGHW